VRSLALVTASAVALATAGGAAVQAPAGRGAPPSARGTRPARPSPAPSPAAATPADENAVYADAAARAWRFVEANLQPSGLVSPLASYPYATVWDIGSGLAALYCAHELRLVDDRRYDASVRRFLATMARADLFDGAAFNKTYATRSGAMVGRDGRASRRGYGWSAVDIGRFLLWLKIVAVHQPQYADMAAAVVRRMSTARLTGGGYMRGSFIESDGQAHDFQEGRVGYEQYSARGLAAWDFPVANALALERNAVPLMVMGKTLVADVRGKDRLTAEPFALLGLELGFAPAERGLAEQLLAAMEERHRRSGRITMLGEDAIDRAPNYFFYYCAYANGKEFTPDVQTPGSFVDAPRWVSTKGAFAWRALIPSDYTAKVLASVLPARTAGGWASGVYEADGRSTATPNVNTQAVILEAALYRERHLPLLEGRR